MSDPSRLVEGDVAFESAVLRAWSARQPSADARVKTLAAVGLASSVLAASGTAVAGAGGSIAPKALVASSLLKWLGIGAGLVAAAGAIGYASHRTKLDVALDDVDEAPAPLASAAPTPLAPSAMSSAMSAAKAPTLPPLPTLPTPPASPAGTVAATAAPVAAPKVAGVLPSSLDDEVLAIDHARRTLAADDGMAALQLVDAYEAKYPNGVLMQESTEIRIEALYRTGNRAQADKLAASFLAAHPSTPYTRAIRARQAAAPPP
jgi:hypothetical protein